jgi:hypothetical protein
VTLTLTAREKPVFGEALVALLFVFLAASVSLAPGLSVRAAPQVPVTWSTVFLVGTATVHALLAREKHRALGPSRVTSALCAALSGSAALWALGGPSGPAAIWTQTRRSRS